jgi:hypothetical protein
VPNIRGWDVFEMPAAIQGPPAGPGILSSTLIYTTDEDEPAEYRIVKWDDSAQTWRFLNAKSSAELGVISTMFPTSGHYALLRKAKR